ncbi:hypothetical protein Fot_14512 [Forsythia ovata]|uniref:Uncharacterized protein n=1 Tax=Forsythia ovata TaxID=205694 RepID=A0ABD1W6J1_9LAMI
MGQIKKALARKASLLVSKRNAAEVASEEEVILFVKRPHKLETHLVEANPVRLTPQNNSYVPAESLSQPSCPPMDILKGEHLKHLIDFMRALLPLPKVTIAFYPMLDTSAKIMIRS